MGLLAKEGNMALELPLGIIAVIVTIAFLCEYMDSTLGMGYGTTLTPILLMMGYNPLQVVPVVLISELISGLLAAVLHHREGNVNLKPEILNASEIIENLNSLGYIGSFRKIIPSHLKVALLLAACSIIGTVLAVFIAVNIPKFWLKLYIGCLVTLMGIVIIICFNKEFGFSSKYRSFSTIFIKFNLCRSMVFKYIASKSNCREETF